MLRQHFPLCCAVAWERRHGAALGLRELVRRHGQSGDQQWLEDLQVPQDAYDLLYRLGQKSVQFDRMKVHNVILMDLLSAKVHVVHFHETHHIHDW